MTLETDLALAQRLADAAGAAIRPFFRAAFTHETKSDASPVTEADRAAEEAIRRILNAEVPRDGIIGEEFGAERPGASRQWVLDPIDGTTSFMAGKPTFGTLIALLQDKGFQNTLTVNRGTVLLGASNALGAGANTAVTVNETTAGETALFDLNGFNQTVASLTFGGTGGTASNNNVSTGSGTLTLGGNVTWTATGNATMPPGPPRSSLQ